MYQFFDVSYAEWKDMNTKVGSDNYVVATQFTYVPVVVDLTRELVYSARIDRSISNADLTDYTTNYLSGAVSAINAVEAVAKEIDAHG